MKKNKKHQKVSHYSYGRYGSSTTIELENILKELEQALSCFFDRNWFWRRSFSFNESSADQEMKF